MSKRLIYTCNRCPVEIDRNDRRATALRPLGAGPEVEDKHWCAGCTAYILDQISTDARRRMSGDALTVSLPLARRAAQTEIIQPLPVGRWSIPGRNPRRRG